MQKCNWIVPLIEGNPLLTKLNLGSYNKKAMRINSNSLKYLKVKHPNLL